jgi:subtilisin family serine protease
MPNSAISEIQARHILDQVPDSALYPPGSQPGGANAEFIYRAGFVLTRERDLRDVLSALARLGPTYSRDNTRLDGGVLDALPIPGVARIKLQFREVENPDLVARAEVMFNTLDAVEQELGQGKVAPDHLLSVATTPAGVVGWCPATEPVPQPVGAPPQPGISGSRCDGRGTLVAVVDGGLVQDAPHAHPWMRGVTGEPDLLAPDGGTIGPYGGHGTFCASVLRAMAPRADVRVARVLKNAGAAYESDVARELMAVLDWAPDVISLSAGTHTWKSGGLLSFKVFVDGPLRAHEGTVLVAAAGNDGADWKFSPAEMEPVIGVGALGLPGDARASFSNWGDWVKVYAPGQDLVHAFACGTYAYQETTIGTTAVFDGMATWSGTSFSTPLVAGLIAARISGTGESARAAADSLLRLARAQALPWVGPVLRPGQACLCACERPRCHHGCRRCGSGGEEADA